MDNVIRRFHYPIFLMSVLMSGLLIASSGPAQAGGAKGLFNRSAESHPAPLRPSFSPSRSSPGRPSSTPHYYGHRGSGGGFDGGFSSPSVRPVRSGGAYDLFNRSQEGKIYNRQAGIVPTSPDWIPGSYVFYYTPLGSCFSHIQVPVTSWPETPTISALWPVPYGWFSGYGLYGSGFIVNATIYYLLGGLNFSSYGSGSSAGESRYAQPAPNAINIPQLMKSNAWLKVAGHPLMVQALNDISDGWQNDSVATIEKHVDPAVKVNIFDNGRFIQAMSAPSYLAATKTAMASVKTTAFRFFSINRQNDGSYWADAVHVYRTKGGQSQYLLFRFSLRRVASRWLITEVNMTSQVSDLDFNSLPGSG
ncbi:MAG: hypothetical protein M1330_03855 [Armatimonadetes bacterium]|nr:hypothetical protein [Armatimonadota bacterium]